VRRRNTSSRWACGDPQIKALAKSHPITRGVTLNFPIDGVVLSRSVSAGQRFEPSDKFYRIADLTGVRITADIFGNDAQLFRAGARVQVTVRERAKTVYATVSQDSPVFDPASCTFKLCLEAWNPGLLLLPDMFVDLEFSTEVPPGGVPFRRKRFSIAACKKSFTWKPVMACSRRAV
jgi:multidrug efflux pump subunit AcrA (membrane-fusion protein)